MAWEGREGASHAASSEPLITADLVHYDSPVPWPVREISVDQRLLPTPEPERTPSPDASQSPEAVGVDNIMLVAVPGISLEVEAPRPVPERPRSPEPLQLSSQLGSYHSLIDMHMRRVGLPSPEPERTASPEPWPRGMSFPLNIRLQSPAREPDIPAPVRPPPRRGETAPPSGTITFVLPSPLHNLNNGDGRRAERNQIQPRFLFRPSTTQEGVTDGGDDNESGWGQQSLGA